MNLILETERLILRPLALSDVDIATTILTDPEIMKYVSGIMTADEVARDMSIAVRRSGGGCIGIWCAVARETGEKLGTSILLPLPIDEDDTDWSLIGGPDIPDAEIEVGYLLKLSAWGKGYATEIAKRLVQFAFEETPLEEIVAVIDPENTASRNVLLKTGLVDEGTRRAYAFDDVPCFRITRQDWQQS